MRLRTSFGFVVEGAAEVQGTYREPTLDEQVLIDDYRQEYKKAMRREPHGLHFIQFAGEQLVAVWLPLEER